MKWNAKTITYTPRQLGLLITWKTIEIVLNILFKIYYTTKYSGKILCNSIK
jgi:hypothetical protein